MRKLATSLILFAAACGGGGSGGGNPSPTQEIRILTQTLDDGNVGISYFQRLLATGGNGSLNWWVSSSGADLPGGLALTADGELTGVPTGPISDTVVVVAQDGDGNLDLVSLSIEVRDVEITASGQSTVLPNTQLTFSASGGNAVYTFSLQANQSGATLSNDTYTAGSTTGQDVIRATDIDGFYDEFAVSVGQDPFVGFQAGFGDSDVWWINWDAVYHPTPDYASDIDEVLVALGLRAFESMGVQGTEADDLARLLLIRRALGHLTTYYGNGIDGNDLPGGLAISFVGPAGPGTGTTPSVGSTSNPGSLRFNTICVRHGPNAGTVGTAWLDPTNNSIEHDCGNPQGTSLGVFANRMLGSYLSAFNNSLVANPVGSSDVAGLRDMLFGAAPQGARESAIFDVADGFGRVLAAVLAHEIGHSLGLNHSSPSDGPGDIMNAALTAGPSVSYAFNSGHWAQLQSNLPGPNR